METTQELTINPKEFGLEEKQAITISQAFEPKVSERNAIKIIYEQIILKELSAETSFEARELRLKCVPIRTGMKKIHTSQKAVALAYGKYCDAVLNAETLPIEQMEERLFEIEKWAEIEDEKRVAILTAERTEILKQYEVDASLISVGQMTEDIWTKYLSGTKLEFEARKAKEAKDEADRIELERLQAEEREKQRLENIRLKEEADKRETAIALEREKFLADAKIIQDKADADKAKADEEARKAKAISDRAIADVKKKADLLAAEIKAKADAEAKIESKKIKAEKLAKAAPDKIKLEAVAKSIDLIISMNKDTFNSTEAKKIHTDSLALLKKVSTFIREKTSQL